MILKLFNHWLFWFAVKIEAPESKFCIPICVLSGSTLPLRTSRPCKSDIEKVKPKRVESIDSKYYVI
jgi:hypothetical protein